MEEESLCKMPESFKIIFIVSLLLKLGYPVLEKNRHINSALFSYLQKRFEKIVISFQIEETNL